MYRFENGGEWIPKSMELSGMSRSTWQQSPWYRRHPLPDWKPRARGSFVVDLDTLLLTTFSVAAIRGPPLGQSADTGLTRTRPFRTGFRFETLSLPGPFPTSSTRGRPACVESRLQSTARLRIEQSEDRRGGPGRIARAAESPDRSVRSCSRQTTLFCGNVAS